MSAEDPAQESQNRTKIMVLGDSCVGKENLVSLLVGDVFDPQYKETLGISMKQLDTRNFQAGVKSVRYEIWCCSGSRRYLPITQQNYSGTNVFCLVYDATSVDSLERCVFWRNEVLRSCPNSDVILVGNKCDLEDQVRVSEENGKKQADAWGAVHFRVSCKSGAGINYLAEELFTMT